MKELRLCTRRGCGRRVKKPTAKYCSIRCCSIDPERHERLRLQARRTNRRVVVPMAQQLSLDAHWARNPEEEIARLSPDREDIPIGMARFAG